MNTVEIVSEAQLAQLAALVPEPVPESFRSTVNGNGHSHTVSPTVDLVAVLQEHGLYRKPLRGGRHALTCPFGGDAHASTVSSTVIFEPPTPGAPWAFHCFAPECQGRGIGDVFRHLGLRATPKAEKTQSEPPLLHAVSAADVIREPRRAEIVRGVAWAGCVGVLAAESGGGKTFVVLDMGAAVSDGKPWLGRDVQPGSVAYIPFESDALGVRLRALNDIAGYKLDHFYVIRASDPLSPRIDYDRVEHPSPGEQGVAAALESLCTTLATRGLPPIVLLIIDTVRASMTGSEDNSESVSAYLRAVRRLLALVPDAAGILVHHAGWQDGDKSRKRERGSSAWRGNCDASLYLEVTEELPSGGARLLLRTLKVRDGEKPAPLHLIRKRVDIDDVDADGYPVTTCLIERDPRSRDEREGEAKAAVDTLLRTQEIRVLRGITKHPDLATSLRQIRVLVGLGSQIVADAVTRCIGNGWLTPGERRQPYALTDAGRKVLALAPADPSKP